MGKQPESLDKITKARLAFSSFGSICSIALTMFFVGVMAVIAVFSTQYLNKIRENIELDVYFWANTPQQITAEDGTTMMVNQAVPESDIRNYELQLKREPFVKTSVFHSRAENTEYTKQIIGSDFEPYTDNPLNASITITLNSKYASQDSIEVIKKYITNQNSQVREVEQPNVIIEFVDKNLRNIQIIILGICGVFLFISLLLIGNSLRLNIYAKRFNIKSLLLIGATRSFVRKPFLGKGFAYGIIGGALATGLVGVVIFGGSQFLQNFIVVKDNEVTIAAILGGTFCFSILFTTISALIFTNRYIKINPDRLYL